MTESSAERPEGGRLHHLAARPETVRWGYYDRALEPVLLVRSGDLIQIQAITHRAGDAPELFMDDPVVATLYDQVLERGPGGHILTGPIDVEGAEPGDSLEVRLLDLRPRGRYGANRATPFGYLFEEFDRVQQVTIYERLEAGGLARPLFRYRAPDIAGIGALVPATARQDLPAQAGIALPLRPHLGIAAVAPAEPGRVSTVPPGRHGGNVDNWRIGAGARMYYPVLVPGALFSVGDPHWAQGDAELNGTAIEASLDVLLQLVLHPRQPIGNPLLETPTHWFTHGFDRDLNLAMRQAALEMLSLL